MKPYLRLAAIAILLTAATGCVSSGWQGLIPDKDVEGTDLTATISTPWGTQTLHAARLASRVDPKGTNATGPQALPPLVVTVLTNPPAATPSYALPPADGLYLYRNGTLSPVTLGGLSLPATAAPLTAPR